MSRDGRLSVGFVAALATPQATAHGFGQRFDLPLPLWLWVTGAGATIVLTFVLMALFVKEGRATSAYPRLDLFRFGFVRRIATSSVVTAIRIVAVLLFVLTVCAGLFGSQDPYSNLITPMVWVAWWVGVAFVCALVGDVWTLINPWRTVFAWAETAYGAMTGGRCLSLRLRYPEWLGCWPAVAIFLGFAWAELIWADKNVPSRLAAVLLGYSVFTWFAMFAFGRERWLSSGEAFSIAFGVLGRFAPLGFADASPDNPHPQLELRPYGAGLMTPRPVSWSFMAFVVLMLATVTFDGFQETALMQRIDTGAQMSHAMASLLFDLSELGLDESRVIHTFTLLAVAATFLAVFWATNWISLRWPRPWTRSDGTEREMTAGLAARSFILTLVPIAVAYHLSHYFSLLLTAGQFIVSLASDPFGWGWNLFGTAGYKVNLAIVSPYLFWYAAVSIIVIGHVIAVYLAHSVALRLFGRQAFMREIPMVLLMVSYTTLSLWILAQPIVG
jgi:hypothetical protein